MIYLHSIKWGEKRTNWRIISLLLCFTSCFLQTDRPTDHFYSMPLTSSSVVFCLFWFSPISPLPHAPHLTRTVTYLIKVIKCDQFTVHSLCFGDVPTWRSFIVRKLPIFLSYHRTASNDKCFGPTTGKLFI